MPQSAFIVRPFGRKPFKPAKREELDKLLKLIAQQESLTDDRKLLWATDKDGTLDVDFDAIERVLIKPALLAARVRGETTGAVVEAGNIREDMFNRLITADLVIADISLPNPNVYYELGLRQAFRDKFTFMIRCNLSPHPFDLQTDRYFDYRLEDLVKDAAPVIAKLTTALKKTLNQYKPDSPVFKAMPQLESEDRARFLSVPDDFREEVERARHQRRPEVLELLALECEGHLWEVEGLRWVGRAQFEANFIDGAKETWERICARYPDDIEANTVLSTVYQRQHDRTRSEQALARVTRCRGLSATRHSELRALTGRNLKAEWIAQWEAEPSDDELSQALMETLEAEASPAVAAGAEGTDPANAVPKPLTKEQRRQLAALRSPLLQAAIDAYVDAFMVDLNNSYAGLNALTLQVVQAELIAKHRHAWKAQQRVASDEQREFAERLQRIDQLAHTLLLSLESDRQRMANRGQGDPWFAMLEAAVMCTVSQQPAYVAQLYTEACYYAPPKSDASMIDSLQMYKKLGIRGEFESWSKPAMLGTLGRNIDAALIALKSSKKDRTADRPTYHIIVFIGLRLDDAQHVQASKDTGYWQAHDQGADKDAAGPFFPESLEPTVRQHLAAVLRDELPPPSKSTQVIAMAGGASGGDLLFHELCLELKDRTVNSQMFLAVPKPTHIGNYVAPAGGEWVARFNEIHKRIKSPEADAKAAARTSARTASRSMDDPLADSDLGTCVRVFSDSTDLPRWLQDQGSYNVGRRAMLWMLKTATELQRAVGADSLTLIALRHAQLSRFEFGGIQYAATMAQRHGANVREIVINQDGTVSAPKPRTQSSRPDPEPVEAASSLRSPAGIVEQLKEVDEVLKRNEEATDVPMPPPQVANATAKARRPGGNGLR